MTQPQPSLAQGISNWYRIHDLISGAKTGYSKDVHSIWVCMSQGSLSPADALWRYQTQAMPLATQYFEYEGAIEATALGIANILRQNITDAQSNFNSLVQKIEQGDGGQSFAAGLKSALDQLKADLNVRVSADGKQRGLTYILGSGVIKNLSNFVQNLLNPIQHATTMVCYSIRKSVTHFHLQTKVSISDGSKSTTTTIYNWSMAVTRSTRVTKSKEVVSAGFYSYFDYEYKNAVEEGQPVSQIFGTFVSNFNNLNQSVSGISSAIQAQMQYLNNNLQEYLGVYKHFMDDYANLSTYIVNKQKSS